MLLSVLWYRYCFVLMVTYSDTIETQVHPFLNDNWANRMTHGVYPVPPSAARRASFVHRDKTSVAAVVMMVVVATVVVVTVVVKVTVVVTVVVKWCCTHIHLCIHRWWW